MQLACGSIFVNEEDWIKQVITKIFQITHSQWVFLNFSLHDKQRGYLRRKDLKTIMVKIRSLLDIRPDEISKDSKFLLEFDPRSLKYPTYMIIDVLDGSNGSSNHS
jgi:hypothetical protein